MASKDRRRFSFVVNVAKDAATDVAQRKDGRSVTTRIPSKGRVPAASSPVQAGARQDTNSSVLLPSCKAVARRRPSVPDVLHPRAPPSPCPRRNSDPAVLAVSPPVTFRQASKASTLSRSSYRGDGSSTNSRESEQVFRRRTSGSGERFPDFRSSCSARRRSSSTVKVPLRSCAECGNTLMPDSIFCRICGAKNIQPPVVDAVTRECHICQNRLLPDAAFCRMCGTKAQEDASPQVHTDVALLILSPEAQLAATRIQSACRGWSVRKHTSRLLADLRWQRRAVQAAIRIQTLFRGWAAKKETIVRRIARQLQENLIESDSHRAAHPIPPKVRSVDGMRVLQEELLEVTREVPDEVCRIELIDCDLFFWEAALTGPDSSPYRGGIFRFEFSFPPDYPVSPDLLTVRCFTPMYHCNIDANGTVCHGGVSGYRASFMRQESDERAESEHLFSKAAPKEEGARRSLLLGPRIRRSGPRSIGAGSETDTAASRRESVPRRSDDRARAVDVIKALLSLLAFPVPEDALVPSVAKLFMSDRKQHDAIARRWTLRYAV